MKVKEEISRKIIESATNEFIKKGISSSSMENISKNAKVSKRTLYKYYPTKDDLFNAIALKLIPECLVETLNYNKNVSIEDQITSIIKCKIDLITSDNYIKISKLVLSELLKSRKTSSEHIKRYYEIEKSFAKWFDEAKEDEKIMADISSEKIVSTLNMLIKDEVFFPIIFGLKDISQIDIEKSIEVVKSIFISAFCKK